MRNRFIKLIFPVIAVLLLAPWPVAYAYSYDGELESPGAVQIEAADASAAPSAMAFGKAIGSIIPGDIFYIDAADSAADFTLTLHLTNADELSRCYRYFIMKVVTYVENDDGEWVRTADGENQLIPDAYLTLKNGSLSFTLNGYGKYKIAADGGSFYCMTTSADGGSLSPDFYLTAD